MNLENISFENISIVSQCGLACIDATGISIKKLHLVTENGPALRFINSNKVDIEGLDVSGNNDTCINIMGEKSENFNIRSIRPVDEKFISIGSSIDRSNNKSLLGGL